MSLELAPLVQAVLDAEQLVFHWSNIERSFQNKYEKTFAMSKKVNISRFQVIIRLIIINY
jgi:hypothetical protein